MKMAASGSFLQQYFSKIAPSHRVEIEDMARMHGSLFEEAQAAHRARVHAIAREFQELSKASSSGRLRLILGLEVSPTPEAPTPDSPIPEAPTPDSPIPEAEKEAEPEPAGGIGHAATFLKGLIFAGVAVHGVFCVAKMLRARSVH